MSGLGLNFHGWRLTQKGAPIDQVEDVARRLAFSGEFAQSHPRAAKSLRSALDSLWSRELNEATASQIGHDLRSTIFDFIADVVDTTDKVAREDPVNMVRSHLATVDLQDRERRVLERLVDMLAAVLRLDQRLDHARDEIDNGLPLPTWEEARRAVFTTAFACHELSRALG